MSQKFITTKLEVVKHLFPEALGAPCMDAFKCDVRHGTALLNGLVVFHASIALKAKSVTRPHDGTAVAQQPPEQAIAMPSDKAKSMIRPHDGTVVADAVSQVVPLPPQVAQQVSQQAAPIASEPKTSKRSAKNFLEIGDVDDLDGLSAEPEPPKLSSKKRREKEEDESQRLKRIMAICAGC